MNFKGFSGKATKMCIQAAINAEHIKISLERSPHPQEKCH